MNYRHPDIVSGEIFGEISHRYTATLRTVETWPKHGERKEYPAREHGFWSNLPTRKAAVAEYIAKQRRESALGDGSPCVVELREVLI